jgi:hypothetical protein
MKVINKFEDFLYEAQKMSEQEEELILDEIYDDLDEEEDSDFYDDEEDLYEGELNEFLGKFKGLFAQHFSEEKIKEMKEGWKGYAAKNEKALASTTSNALFRTWLRTRIKDKAKAEENFKAIRKQKTNAATSFQNQKDIAAMGTYMKKPIPGGPLKTVPVSILVMSNLSDTLAALKRSNKPLYEALGGDKSLAVANSFVVTRLGRRGKGVLPVPGSAVKPAAPAAGETKPAAGDAKPAGETKPAGGAVAV